MLKGDYASAVVAIAGHHIGNTTATKIRRGPRLRGARLKSGCRGTISAVRHGHIAPVLQVQERPAATGGLHRYLSFGLLCELDDFRIRSTGRRGLDANVKSNRHCGNDQTKSEQLRSGSNCDLDLSLGLVSRIHTGTHRLPSLGASLTEIVRKLSTVTLRRLNRQVSRRRKNSEWNRLWDGDTLLA